jgi:resuscitation-promoting factor RpfA
MTPHHEDPLGTEERELARRLARLGASAEPSAALDARILDAARVPGATATLATSRRPRWQVGFGVAASLALAMGVAWQLRPLPDSGRQQPFSPPAIR